MLEATGAQEAPQEGETPSLRHRLSAASAEARLALALEFLREQTAGVLGLAASELPVGRALDSLGLDSLMAVEMRNRLAAAVGRQLPATLLFNHPSLDALAEFVVGTLGGNEAEALVAEGSATPTDDDDLDLDSMSEDEMADLLAAKLRDV